MYFVRKTEQNAIIFLYITLLVQTTQIVCIYWAVRTRFLNIIEGKVSLQTRVRQGSSGKSPVSHRGEPIGPGSVHVRSVAATVALGQIIFCEYFSFPLSISFHHCSILIHLPPTLHNVFLPVLQFSPVNIIPPLLHTHSSTTHAL